MSSMPRPLGTTLRTLRDETSMSQTALATKARIPREHLSHLEAGRYEPSE
jgi:DNA-binding XRE family transcriptional regulator